MTLNAITQTVLDQTRHLQMYKLYNDSPNQQELMEKILRDATAGREHLVARDVGGEYRE